MMGWIRWFLAIVKLHEFDEQVKLSGGNRFFCRTDGDAGLLLVERDLIRLSDSWTDCDVIVRVTKYI